jgi:hypothetical protein
MGATTDASGAQISGHISAQNDNAFVFMATCKYCIYS